MAAAKVRDWEPIVYIVNPLLQSLLLTSGGPFPNESTMAGRAVGIKYPKVHLNLPKFAGVYRFYLYRLFSQSGQKGPLARLNKFEVDAEF